MFNPLKLEKVGRGALKGMPKACISPSPVQMFLQMFLEVAKNKQTHKKLQKELSLHFPAGVPQNSFSRAALKKNPSLIRASSDPPWRRNLEETLGGLCRTIVNVCVCPSPSTRGCLDFLQVRLEEF